MKRQFFVPVLAGAILLSGFGIFSAAQGQSSDQPTNPILLPENLPYEDFEATDHDPNSIPVEDAESDPAVETRNLEREFAGTNLTPEQFEQVRQVRRQFRAEMAEAAKTRFPQLLLMMLLPQERAERLGGDIFGAAIENYGEGVSQILTPEQLRIWKQNMEEYAQSKQQ